MSPGWHINSPLVAREQKKLRIWPRTELYREKRVREVEFSTRQAFRCQSQGLVRKNWVPEIGMKTYGWSHS